MTEDKVGRPGKSGDGHGAQQRSFLSVSDRLWSDVTVIQFNLMNDRGQVGLPRKSCDGHGAQQRNRPYQTTT